MAARPLALIIPFRNKDGTSSHSREGSVRPGEEARWRLELRGARADLLATENVDDRKIPRCAQPVRWTKERKKRTTTPCGKERKGWGAQSEGPKMKRRRRVFDEPAALLDSFFRSASRENKHQDESEHEKDHHV
ncbi:hypothetical protein MTO96_025616 [Rhipicephalus appendiculatus]